MYQPHADNSILRIKVQTVTMSFRPSGEILIVPSRVGWAGKRNEVETPKADRPCPSIPGVWGGHRHDGHALLCPSYGPKN